VDGVADVRLCQVTLGDDVVRYLRELGGGNLSYGIRRAARDVYPAVKIPVKPDKRVYGGQKRRQVSLDDRTVEFLGWLGGGSLSFGIRQAVEVLKAERD
jgi:hypothetical protein